MGVQAFVLAGSAICLFFMHFSKHDRVREQDCKLESQLSWWPGPELNGVGRTGRRGVEGGATWGRQEQGDCQITRLV